jgi:Xaa-Pro aminopeptidase
MPAKLIYASSNTCADMLFASGFMAYDPFIYFSADRTEGIIVSALEYGRALNEVKPGIKVYEIADIMGDGKHLTLTKDILFKLTEMFPYNEWQVPADFPFSLGKFLQTKHVDIKCMETRFFPERETKNQAELKALKNALNLAEKAMQRAADMITESKIDNTGMLRYKDKTLTSEWIKTEIGIEIIRGGGIADHTIVACGKHASEPHNTGSGPLYANQTIVIDIFPRVMNSADNRHDDINNQDMKSENDAQNTKKNIPNKNALVHKILPGYWGDISRTFVKGKASEIVKNAYRAVTLARDGCENMIKEGIIASDVHKFAQKVLNDCGFETGKTKGVNYGFFHGLGHGVGLEIHEAPSVSLRNSQILKAGDVATVEPGLYYPEWGGIRLENMVIVQKNNCKILTEFPDFLEIK